MSDKSRAILYAYWMSSCSWRVRAVLNLKKIPFEECPIDIVKQRQQISDTYWALNPAQKVPALVIELYSASRRASLTVLRYLQSLLGQRSKLSAILDYKKPMPHLNDVTLVESMAIVQYLDETRPDPPLSPSPPLMRARVREICEIVVSGIQPLQNMGLKPHFDTEEQFVKFSKYWTVRGLETLEEILKKSSGKYCVGDQITVADICLVPQLYNAVSRYSLDLSKYPTVSRINEKLLTEKFFQESHPRNVKTKKVK